MILAVTIAFIGDNFKTNKKHKRNCKYATMKKKPINILFNFLVRGRDKLF